MWVELVSKSVVKNEYFPQFSYLEQLVATLEQIVGVSAFFLYKSSEERAVIFLDPAVKIKIEPINIVHKSQTPSLKVESLVFCCEI